MPSDTIVDNRLSVPIDLGSAVLANSTFLSTPANRGHLANQLLLYDRIAIPTKDFGMLPILASWLGYKCLAKAIDSNTLHFLHKPTMLGYAGNGVGLAGFTIKPSPEKAFQWWQEAVFGDASKAAELQLTHMCPSIGRAERSCFLSGIARATTEVSMSGLTFDTKIERETYTDILNSEELKRLISELSGNPSTLDLKRVPGVKADGMKVSHNDSIRDPPDMILRIAETNLSLLMANQIGGCDVYAPDGADRLLISKLARSGFSPSSLEKFASLLELANVRDPGVAVASAEITLEDIWKLRERTASRKFRQWLRRATPGDARDLEKMYVDSLGKRRFADGLPAKALRFTVTAAAGVVNPVFGVAAGAVDSFFVDLWLKGYTPKLFLDELVSIYPDNSYRKPTKV